MIPMDAGLFPDRQRYAGSALGTCAESPEAALLAAEDLKHWPGGVFAETPKQFWIGPRDNWIESALDSFITDPNRSWIALGNYPRKSHICATISRNQNETHLQVPAPGGSDRTSRLLQPEC